VKFENIHPFADGNGRTGRLALNYYLLQKNSPPVIIYEEDRKKYFEALEAWDSRQKLEPMIIFLQEQSIKTWEKNLVMRS
jgi:Fic family protein